MSIEVQFPSAQEHKTPMSAFGIERPLFRLTIEKGGEIRRKPSLGGFERSNPLKTFHVTQHVAKERRSNT